MTRNTKLHKLKFADKFVIVRDLTVKELSFLNGIKNEAIKNEFAAKLALTEQDENIQWPILQQIGERVLAYSTRLTNDKQLLELAINEFRESITNSTEMSLISHIVRVFPSESITKLLDLTETDLIELVCLAEYVSNSQIFTVGDSPVKKKKGRKLINPSDLSEDDGKDLQQKMNELNAMLGYGK